MKTQTFKAKDVKSAINLVNTEFGDRAIILSTKKNNGLVEVEASDNDEIISDHKKKIEEKKNFSNVFLKEFKTNSLKTNINNENKVSYLKNKDFEDKNDNFQSSSKEIFEKIRDDISSLRKEMNGMIVTDQSGISDELSHQTPIKLRQEKFSPEIINKLNYSFIGKNLEDGRVSFLENYQENLHQMIFLDYLNLKIYLFLEILVLENQLLLLNLHLICRMQKIQKK